MLLLAACHRESPRSVTVAAAADLQFALDDLLRDFRQSHPNQDVRVVYGSSGNFYSQLRTSAPFDLFLSADVQYPRQLASAGLAVQDTLFTYAAGRIVVWVPAASAIDVSRGMAAMEDVTVKHIAIANPEHAPYGKAAVAAMKSAGVYDRIASKLVMGESISQAMQFVQSGAAEIGIVALSLAMAPQVRDAGRYWEVPLDSYPRIEQGGVLLKRSEDNAVARDLLIYLRSDAARAVLKRYGFSAPDDH
jgi:molybdate transport system substrate-binding protein